MTRKIAKLALAGLMAGSFIAAAGAAWAHHSYAMFDRKAQADVSGTVRTVQWTNPHVYLWMNAVNKSGAQEVWGFEFGGGPNGLVRNGWSKNTLKPGDKITVKYHPLKDGRTGGEFMTVLMANGKTWDQRGEVPAGGRPVRAGQGGE